MRADILALYGLFRSLILLSMGSRSARRNFIAQLAQGFLKLISKDYQRCCELRSVSRRFLSSASCARDSCTMRSISPLFRLVEAVMVTFCSFRWPYPGVTFKIPFASMIKGYLHLRDAAGSRWYAFKPEAAQRHIVRCHRPFTLQDMDIHCRLVIRGG